MRTPEIRWFSVDNPPMTGPATVSVLRGPDGRQCLTLQESDTVVSVVLHPSEIGQLRDILAGAPHPTEQ